MLGTKFVIDAVAHAFDATPANYKAGRYAELALESFFGLQWRSMPGAYRLTRDEYFQPIRPEVLTSALFLESDTDVAVYHSIPAWGVFHDLSPIDVGLEIRDAHPGRMYLYGAVSPLEGRKALDDLARQVEQWNIIGVKLYPMDIIKGELQSYALNDELVAYPILEQCRELGVKSVAVHKSIPLGNAPLDPFAPNDVDYAARDFPDINFEIVHGGFAFLEETARQIGRFENVYVNLESTAQLLLTRPRRFAEILGELLYWGGGADKIYWGTGCAATHAQPVLEAFESFEMPADLVDAYGVPDLTQDMKRAILAGNFARTHDMKISVMAEQVAGDELDVARNESRPSPWAALRSHNARTS